MKWVEKCFWVIVIATVVFGMSYEVEACAVCYGDPDDPMTIGLNWSVLVLGSVIVSLLGTFGWFFIYLIRRSKKVDAAEIDPWADMKVQSK